LNAKKISEKYNLASEWKVLTELASGLGVNSLDQEKANLDLSLNKNNNVVFTRWSCRCFVFN